MVEFKSKVNCSQCGNKDTVTVTTRNGKFSRSVKVSKCEVCGYQSGVKATLNNENIK